MKRDLLNHLRKWQTHPLRKPLILRGARQVGKSWLAEEFSKEFENSISINFEKNKEAATLFPEDIKITSIIKNISYYAQKPIHVGKTLLFLDEIQECPNALRALRYFKEDCPNLHVMAAGSLLEFLIDQMGMPVGRVQFLYLYPLSFAEFLTALNRDDLRELLYDELPAPAIHKQLLEMVKLYSFVGGMPDVVATWLKYEDVRYCQEAQDAIILTYQQDFHKYARSKQIEYVSAVFERIPDQLGKKFILSQVDQHISFHQLRQALFLLHKAGIVHYCYHTSAQGHPLAASKNLKKFKIFFFDIGLAQRILGTPLSDWVTQPVLPQHGGSMAEQFVAQQLIAHSSASAPAELYYWHREEKSSSAEIDFVFAKETEIIPIEVKSGIKGQFKSLELFLESHPHSTYGVIISSSDYRDKNHYLRIPFYAIEAWLRKKFSDIEAK